MFLTPLPGHAQEPPAHATPEDPPPPRSHSLGNLEVGKLYSLLVAWDHPTLPAGSSLDLAYSGPGGHSFSKRLHEGDPDLLITLRALENGPAALTLNGPTAWTDHLKIQFEPLEIPPADQPALEAEPNNSWSTANPLPLGRAVYGLADDVDYLDNPAEGQSGLDYFQVNADWETPRLVYFWLDILDRDVSCNLRFHHLKDGKLVPYTEGKDPNEVVHDRERERYSKHISRVLPRGTYYLEVNANHPDYILRSRVLELPPYNSPAQAVSAGAQYLMQIGDAWFNQISREGNIYTRAASLHDTATRCTACHPAAFPTEAALTAQAAGYPIEAKNSYDYVIERLYNSITPLYGGEGLYWQRFIAIPLQAQGKQGGLLLDHEAQVSGKKLPITQRFAPFLAAAWRERAELPADELNGVVPLDSKFGIAWRDERVLRELGERHQNTNWIAAAANIRKILLDPKADARVESLQDRMHRLVAWARFDPQGRKDRIAAEINALAQLQNDDGGWHEVDSKRGPSAVYATGQMVWSWIQAGVPRDDPRIDRAVAYLLAQQQPFGAWFQTTSHENFRTPMRESRYALMALAAARPALPPDQVPRSIGNRDGRPPRPPRADSGLIPLLDDLENLWDVPESNRIPLENAIIPLLDHPSPLVRAAAAASLGRWAGPSAVASLSRKLNDTSKSAWRAAAWAVRRIVNRHAGLGADVIREALIHHDPRVRRGAARVLAYQFPSLDSRADLPLQLLERSADPDLLTRLQALKTLRHWFYRTADPSLQKRIVRAYLAGLDRPEHPVIRRNLTEGLYILMDENLGGGVSLQKNLAQLPKPNQDRALAARAQLERAILLDPILETLASGSIRQKEGILAAFDGSFFAGRFYARQPEAMIDVGNDREFGFLAEPDLPLLERALLPAIQPGSPLNPAARAQALRLAAFFKLPARSTRHELADGVLAALGSDQPPILREAAAVAAQNLRLPDPLATPQRDRLVQLLGQGGAARATALALMKSRPLLEPGSPLFDSVARIIQTEGIIPGLAPLLHGAGPDDITLAAALEHSWNTAAATPHQFELLDLALARPAILEHASKSGFDLIERALVAPAAEVRRKVLESLGASGDPEGLLRRRVLLAALVDPSAELRRLGLALSEKSPCFWTRAEAREYLMALLIDRDAATRREALALVNRARLIEGHPDLARRVKSLAADPALESAAFETLKSQGYDPAAIVPDAPLLKPPQLDLATFRSQLEPIFYEPSADGQACADCHQNHAILRIAAPQDLGTPAATGINYLSALKVINSADPEASLLLRKPRSPHGQGLPEAASPTGITHVGGPRWENTDHPAYKALLAWIRNASRSEQRIAATAAADSYAPGNDPEKALDGDPATFWHTEFQGATPGYPHEIALDLGQTRTLAGLLVTPRQDSSQGRVARFEIRLSSDGKSWSEPVAQGAWPDDPEPQYVGFNPQSARFLKLTGLAEVAGRPFMALAEIQVDAAPSSPQNTP
jgi:HEAT repeat protein